MSHEWMTQAACIGADVNLFFAEGRNEPARRRTAEALFICMRCPVTTECLNYYMTEVAPDDVIDVGGVWGGTTLSTRRQMRAGHAKPHI